MSKPTIKSLQAIILDLEEKNTRLQEATELKNKWQENKGSSVILVAADKQLGGKRWLLKKLGFQTLGGETFLNRFNLYTNQEKNWFSLIQKENIQYTPEMGVFVKSVLGHARALNLESNYWKTHGVFVKI